MWDMTVEQVTRLTQSEPIGLDPKRLDELYLQLGPSAAEDVVCRALEEMAARLAQIDRSHGARQFDLLFKNARGLSAISEQLGMHLLSQVARDVTYCAGNGDRTALAATLARLMRIGERSLTEIWEMAAH